MAAEDEETGQSMSDAELRDAFVTTLLGGTESSATTLSWAFYELARHPENARLIRAEYNEVIGVRQVTVADLPKLPYLDRVVREVTRLHAAPLVMRRALAAVEFGGIHFPVGTELAFSPYALHHDPGLFPDPERFDPDRWLSGNTVPRNAYLPFGAGLRKCIGDSFAWTMVNTVLATIVPRWQLEPAPGHAVKELLAGFPRPNALPMITTAPSRPGDGPWRGRDHRR